MSQTSHATRVASPILVSFSSPETALKAANAFIQGVLYPGEKREIPPVRDEFGDVSFNTYAGSVRVVRSITDQMVTRLEIPASPFDNGYSLPDDLVANFCKAGGKFSAMGLGHILNKIGDTVNQAQIGKQTGPGAMGHSRHP